MTLVRPLDGPGRFPEQLAPVPQGVLLRFVVGQPDRRVVRVARVVVAAESSQQVGADGVVGVVRIELEIVDRLETGRGAVDLRKSDRPIQRHDRRGCPQEQLVVEGDDLRPVRLLGLAASVWTAFIAAWIWYGPG